MFSFVKLINDLQNRGKTLKHNLQYFLLRIEINRIFDLPQIFCSFCDVCRCRFSSDYHNNCQEIILAHIKPFILRIPSSFYQSKIEYHTVFGQESLIDISFEFILILNLSIHVQRIWCKSISFIRSNMISKFLLNEL